MAPRCPVCGKGFGDSDKVVQLESADIFHARCWVDELADLMSGEIAKIGKFGEVIHPDWL